MRNHYAVTILERQHDRALARLVPRKPDTVEWIEKAVPFDKGRFVVLVRACDKVLTRIELPRWIDPNVRVSARVTLGSEP